jgi:hypothetical protein
METSGPENPSTTPGAPTVSYEPKGYCPGCGYRMDAGTCPECGRVVKKPARRSPRSTRRRKVLVSAAIGLMILGGESAVVHYREPLARRYWPTWHLRSLAQGDGKLARWAFVVLADRYEERSKKERGPLAVRRSAIKRELLLPTTPDWAGRYENLWGGFSARLILAPFSGFVWTSDGDVYHHWNHGDVAVASAGRIRLRPIIDREEYGFGGPAKELIRIRWLGRDYVIERSDLVGFANDVNRGAGGAPGWYMSRGKGKFLDPDGPLEVPEDSRRYFLAAPVLVRVAAMHDFTRQSMTGGGLFYQVYVTLAAGSAQGLFPGMELFRSTPPGRATADIKSVSDSTADAVVSIIVEPGDAYAPPDRDWVFSSREYDEGDLRESIEYHNAKLRGRDLASPASQEQAPQGP